MKRQKITDEERFANTIAAAATYPETRRGRNYQVEVIGRVKDLGALSGSHSYEFSASIRAGQVPGRMQEISGPYFEKFSLVGEESDTNELRDDRLESLRLKATGLLEGKFELKESPGSFTIIPIGNINYKPSQKRQ